MAARHSDNAWTPLSLSLTVLSMTGMQLCLRDRFTWHCTSGSEFFLQPSYLSWSYFGIPPAKDPPRVGWPSFSTPALPGTPLVFRDQRSPSFWGIYSHLATWPFRHSDPFRSLWQSVSPNWSQLRFQSAGNENRFFSKAEHFFSSTFRQSLPTEHCSPACQSWRESRHFCFGWIEKTSSTFWSN